MVNPESSPPALPHLRLGSLDVGFPVVQAALAGYSDWPMRTLAVRLGAPFTWAEVALERFVVQGTRRQRGRRILRPTVDAPSGGQLMGEDSPEIVDGARRLVALGFAAIDLNFACPVRKVLGKNRGGHLMTDPAAAIQIVRRVRDGLPHTVPVSVKLRRGFDDTEPSRERFWEILDGCYAAGADAVTLHPRTVRQRYEGPSDWRLLAEAKRHVGRHTLLGSGDLFSAADCLRMIHQTGVDGVTAARGAIGNPWIFQQARALATGEPWSPPSLAEQRTLIEQHYQLAEQTYGPRRACQTMRKFGIKYARLHPNQQQVRDAFVAVTRPDDWRAVLDHWYTTDV